VLQACAASDLGDGEIEVGRAANSINPAGILNGVTVIIDDIKIVTGATIQRISACTAIKRIVAVGSYKRVIPGIAGNSITRSLPWPDCS
jgi:hypothetical protein